MGAPQLYFHTTAGVTLTTYSFGTLTAGEESTVLETILWNNKDGAFAADEAINTLLSARVDSASEINDPLDEGWVYLRSDGTENPDGVEDFFDDNQTVYTQITRFNNLSIGDIPSGCGRHVFVKIIIPVTSPSQTDVAVRLVAGTGVNSYPLPYFFNRAFGDGVVDNYVPQIFPAILHRKIGSWTDVEPVSGGAYTGLTEKEYLVRIASGTTIGYFTYETSDDNGSSYGTPITSSTSAFTAVKSSANVDEGVTIFWNSEAGQSVSVGDTWKIHASIDPYDFIPGLSTSLEGYVGWGEALVYNNRVFHQSPTRIAGLTPNSTNYIFLGFDGSFTATTVGNPQYGKLLLGWFQTNSTTVTDQRKQAPKVTMGLDLWDDFGPMYNNISGLTFVYFKGKYREFNEVVQIPTSGFPFGTISLLASLTNYIQLNPITREVTNMSTGYDTDNIPLFRIGTGTTYIKAIEDDRTRLGVTTYHRGYTGTISNLATGLSNAFTFTDFANRANVKKLIVTPTQAGASYTVQLYEDSSYATLEYAAEQLSGTFTDPVNWWHLDQSKSEKLYGIITNNIGATSSFTFDFLFERFQ